MQDTRSYELATVRYRDLVVTVLEVTEDPKKPKMLIRMQDGFEKWVDCKDVQNMA